MQVDNQDAKVGLDLGLGRGKRRGRGGRRGGGKGRGEWQLDSRVPLCSFAGDPVVSGSLGSPVLWVREQVLAGHPEAPLQVITVSAPIPDWVKVASFR